MVCCSFTSTIIWTSWW